MDCDIFINLLYVRSRSVWKAKVNYEVEKDLRRDKPSITQYILRSQRQLQCSVGLIESIKFGRFELLFISWLFYCRSSNQRYLCLSTAIHNPGSDRPVGLCFDRMRCPNFLLELPWILRRDPREHVPFVHGKLMEDDGLTSANEYAIDR